MEVFPDPADARESAKVIRQADAGCIAVAFVSYPMRAGAPPEGVRAAVIEASRRVPCSAAVFFWSDRVVADRWLREQFDRRRRSGQPIRVVLTGHGLGATEAAEKTKDLLARDPDVEIALLLTVDAIKPGRIGSMSGTAGATGGALAKRLPGVNVNFAAYDSAPAPDGLRFRSHIHYYQDKSQFYHGSAMPGAENHLLEDWTGLLNHGNSDDFALPLIVSDLRAVLEGRAP